MDPKLLIPFSYGMLAMGLLSCTPDPPREAEPVAPQEFPAIEVQAPVVDTLWVDTVDPGRAPAPKQAEPARDPEVPARMWAWSGTDPGNAEGRMDVDLAPTLLAAHPDTVALLAREFYRAQRSSFPVSIADDFENGVATEHIHYPRIRLAIHFFKDHRSLLPYTVRTVTVYMDEDSVRVD